MPLYHPATVIITPYPISAVAALLAPPAPPPVDPPVDPLEIISQSVFDSGRVY